MPKTMRIACTEYEKRVVATVRKARRAYTIGSVAASCDRSCITCLYAHARRSVVTLARTKLETERK